MKRTLQAVLGLCLLLPARGLAQAPGSLDVSFTPATAYSDVLWGVAVQPDGKILACGREGTSYGVTYGVVYRLNADGTLDAGFNSGARATNLDSTIPQINALAQQTNGRIVLGGAFTYFDASIRFRLAQLTANGDLDTAFAPSVLGPVFALAIQSDGKILVGGNFTNFRGSGKNYLGRLLLDGSLDTSFNPQGNGPQGIVYAVALDPDGKILIGGDFTSVNGFSRPHVARLLADGSVDETFDPSTSGPDGTVDAVAAQPDRKVVIGGAFTHIGVASRGRVARLDSLGALDTSFDPGSGCDNYTVWAVAVQLNGKILAGGRFTSVNGQPRSKIVRFTSEGAIDTTFDVLAGAGTSSSDEIRALAIQPDGKIVLAGKFTTFSSQSRYGIARLFGDPGVLPQPQLLIKATFPSLILDWTGSFTLQSASSVTGPYSDVSGNPTPPYTVPSQSSMQFFRLRN